MELCRSFSYCSYSHRPAKKAGASDARRGRSREKLEQVGKLCLKTVTRTYKDAAPARHDARAREARPRLRPRPLRLARPQGQAEGGGVQGQGARQGQAGPSRDAVLATLSHSLVADRARRLCSGPGLPCCCRRLRSVPSCSTTPRRLPSPSWTAMSNTNSYMTRDTNSYMTRASNKDFGRIQWNRLEPMGVGGLQSNNRFRLRSGRNQKRLLTVSDDFCRPAAPFREFGAQG
jgi:hypothetical protein